MNTAPETAARSGVGRPLPQPAPSIWQELERWSHGFADWQKLLLASAVRNGPFPARQSIRLTRSFSLNINLHPLRILRRISPHR